MSFLCDELVIVAALFTIVVGLAVVLAEALRAGRPEPGHDDDEGLRR